MQLVDIRIGFYYRIEFLFGKKVYLCIRQLLLQATDDGCGEYDVANGTEAYDEDFLQALFFLYVQKYKKSRYKVQGTGCKVAKIIVHNS